MRRISLQKRWELEKGSLNHAAISETTMKPPACLPQSLDTGISRNNPSVKAQQSLTGSVTISCLQRQLGLVQHRHVGLFPELLEKRKCPRFLLEVKQNKKYHRLGTG